MSAITFQMEPACALALEASFGSPQAWAEDWAQAWEAAQAAEPAQGDKARGHLALVFLPDGSLVNRQPASLDKPQAAEGTPLLHLALHEGPRTRADLNAWVSGIDWAATYARYQAAVDAASESLGVPLDALRDQTLLDVRRAGVYAQASHRIPGARWQDPAQVRQWAQELPADRPVLVYCVYGHEVGRATTLRLRAAGLDARFLQGGIDAWRREGRELEEKGK